MPDRRLRLFLTLPLLVAMLGCGDASDPRVEVPAVAEAPPSLPARTCC